MRRPERVEPEQLVFELPEFWGVRPRTRGDCVNAVRPCPWLSCAHHLGIDIELRGGEGRPLAGGVRINIGRTTETDAFGHQRNVTRRTGIMSVREMQRGDTVDDRAEQLVDWWLDGRPTCVLDIADRGGATLEEVGAAMSITRERARQLMESGLAKLKQPAEEAGLQFNEEEDDAL